MRNGFGWWRLAKQVVLGVQRVVSYALSTFTTNDWDFTADNVDDATDTLTVYGDDGALMVGASVVFTSEDTFVDAATCTLETNDAEIETTVGTATITAHVYNDAGTPLPGIPAASLSLASTGTGNTITAVDTVTDRNGRFRWTFSSTSAAAKTLTLTALGIVVTDTAAVTVTGTPTAITPLFASDWRTATGTSAAAVRDTSGITAPTVWTVAGGANVVVANSGLGFPVGPTNVLHVPGDTGGIVRVSGLTAQTAGVQRYFRVYSRIDLPYPTTDTQTHPFQDGNAGGDCNWAVLMFNGTVTNFASADATYYRIAFNFPATQAAWYEQIYYGPLLERGVVYQLEWMVEYASSTTLNADIRISDADGLLLYTSDDFYDGRGAAAGRELSTRNGTGTFVARTIANSDGLNIGTNDIYAEFAPDYGYQAAVAIADDQDWIGPFGNVSGE